MWSAWRLAMSLISSSPLAGSNTALILQSFLFHSGAQKPRSEDGRVENSAYAFIESEESRLVPYFLTDIRLLPGL